MRLVYNQPGRFFATAKTRKFTSLNDITVENLKSHPIIDLTRTYTYNNSKVKTNYFRPLSKIQYTIADTLKFPDLLKLQIPVLNRIYTNKELKPLCKKPIFKTFLIKLAKESHFSGNNCLIKQIDGCPMRGPISVIFSGICMCKMEEDVVKPLKPIFYKRYVDDTYLKRKRNKADTLFDALNLYHPNIKFTLERKPKKFLDTHIIKENRQIKAQVFVKKCMYPVHWSLKVPLQYKKNAINGELHRAKKISSNFQVETARIKATFSKAGFPHKVIGNTINNFNNVDEELFDDRKTIEINLPFSNKDAHFSKKFCEKLEFYKMVK